MILSDKNQKRGKESFSLPKPRSSSDIPIEKALLMRRSIREYARSPLELEEVSQLLWAAQGITHPGGFRTAPSAGALFPLEIYMLAGDVTELPAGIYHFHPHEHELTQIQAGDYRQALYEAALKQDFFLDASIVLVFAAVVQRTTVKYGERGIMYVHMEVGSAVVNVHLQVTSMGLGSVFVGAFYNDQIRRVIELPAEEEPLALLPIGKLK